jgi:putative hydrolase of the HAD superfamily
MGFYRRAEYVLFDVNGTLIHRTQPFSYFNRLSAQLGVSTSELLAAMQVYSEPFERGRITPVERWHKIKQELELSGGPSAGWLARLETNYAIRYWEYYPGARELIRWLRQNGVKVALCSNQNPIGRSIVTQLGLNLVPEVVDACVLSCDVGWMKPEGPIYQRAILELRATPGQCLFVGDGGSQELVGAKQQGMPTACVLHDDGFAGENPNHPDIAVADFAIELIANLRQLFEHPAC